MNHLRLVQPVDRLGQGVVVTVIYGLPHNGKKLIDILALWDAPAVVYPASDVGSDVARADMESASPKRQSLRTAAKEPQELSASVGVG